MHCLVGASLTCEYTCSMTEDGSDEVKLCAVQADHALFYISHLDTFPEVCSLVGALRCSLRECDTSCRALPQFFDVDKPLNQQARKATYQARVMYACPGCVLYHAGA